MSARRPWRRCPDCGSQCHWVEPAWLCDRCRHEFTQAADAKFAPPGEAGPLLFTCSYSEHRPDMGLGVRISLGTPRWIKRVDPWPYVSEVTPRRSYLNVPDESLFLDAYLAQLRSVGAGRIRDEFRRIAYLYDTDRLVLLCFEKLSKGELCHRRYFASWWYTETGQEVPELGEVATHEQLTLDIGAGS